MRYKLHSYIIFLSIFVLFLHTPTTTQASLSTRLNDLMDDSRYDLERNFPIERKRSLTCDSCGNECSNACGTKNFRTCCFNYLRKRNDPNVMKSISNQHLIDFILLQGRAAMYSLAEHNHSDGLDSDESGDSNDDGGAAAAIKMWNLGDEKKLTANGNGRRMGKEHMRPRNI